MADDDLNMSDLLQLIGMSTAPQQQQPQQSYGVVENRNGARDGSGLQMTQPGPYDISQIRDNQAGQTPMPQPRPANAPQQPPVPMPPPRPYVVQGQGGSSFAPPVDPSETGQAMPNYGGDSDALAAITGGPARPPQQQQGNDPAMMASAAAGGMPNVPPPAAPPGGPPQQAGVPLPPPRPPNIPPQQAALPPNASPTAGGPPPGPPLSLAPPQGVPLPPQAQPPQAQAPVPGAPRPGYETAYQPRKGFMGMTPEQAARLGAGLSAVGSNWNKPGLAAMAGTAGAAIQGGEKSGEQQKTDDMKANAQHFNQLSTSFRDTMLSQQAGNTAARLQAQAKYLSARADAIDRGQGPGSGAASNTPQGRALAVEKQYAMETDRGYKVLQQQWKQNGTPEPQQQQQQAALEAKMQARRAQLYQQIGMDPNVGAKIASQGQAKDNPLDASQMNAAQFHSQVPMGAWFKNKDGKVYQRVKGPPGTEDHSELTPNVDDMMAMQAQPEAQIPTSPVN